MSGVELKKLKRDLERARDATAQIDESYWLHLYITPDEAAAILGVSNSALAALPLTRFPEFQEGGGGLRYFREQVEWYRDTGDNLPDSWRPHFESQSDD